MIMTRIFAIGNDDCILGLSLIGIEGQAVRDRQELQDALDAHLRDESIGLLLVTEDVAAWERERIDGLKAQLSTPLVVEIPGLTEDPHRPSLREFAQRAAGIRLGDRLWPR